MLQLLHIENIAVIERADIEFGAGFNVLTGETGAGKSIVIDALNAVTGARVSRELVRTGAGAAGVTALFSSVDGEAWCRENGIEPEDDGLVVSRRFTADGKSSCRVCGVPVAVSQLRELGALLIDVHGQNDGRKLMDESSHLKYLDAFAGDEEELDAYRGVYEQLRQTEKEIEALTMDESEKERRMDMLRYQIGELERASLEPGEMDRLSERRELLKNASRLTDALETAFAALYGGEEGSGASSLLSDAEGALHGAARYAQQFEPLAARLRDLRYGVQDAAEELRDLLEELDFSPEELDRIEARLDTLKRLSRKYGGSEEEMLAFLDSCRKELSDIELSSDRIEVLRSDRERLFEKAGKCAAVLTKKRQDAAKDLEKRIMAELGDLNMKGTRFAVEFSPAASEDGLTSTGADAVRFLISANAGETPGRISRIASGGELSRIMLAMKNVLSQGEEADTLVFDEVDAGVSGIAAQRVAEKLCSLAAEKQVLCVTHLPQIAAMADVHFEISKSVRDGRTYTSVERLDMDGRRGELARLIGGENVTETTLASASELIAASERYKAARKRP